MHLLVLSYSSFGGFPNCRGEHGLFWIEHDYPDLHSTRYFCTTRLLSHTGKVTGYSKLNYFTLLLQLRYGLQKFTKFILNAQRAFIQKGHQPNKVLRFPKTLIIFVLNHHSKEVNNSLTIISLFAVMIQYEDIALID